MGLDVIQGLPISVSGKLCRVAQLQNEGYDFVDTPEALVDSLRAARIAADLFTFHQRVAEPQAKYSYVAEPFDLAVLSFESFEKWWKNQINDKTRNMVRKPGKKGVTIRPVEFNDEFVHGVKAIYDESPVRQGKRFRHYGKDVATLKREHATFLDRSEFIGAYCSGQLIGFVKLVYQGAWASMMNIISKISERDKAPTNGLIAKAVEHCSERGIGLLQYGIWSRRGIGDFKLHHGFQCYSVPRYYVPLNGRGRLLLRLKFHKGLLERLPGDWVDGLTHLRTRWYSLRYSR
jgi:hypothetical protein